MKGRSKEDTRRTRLNGHSKQEGGTEGRSREGEGAGGRGNAEGEGSEADETERRQAGKRKE